MPRSAKWGRLVPRFPPGGGLFAFDPAHAGPHVRNARHDQTYFLEDSFNDCGIPYSTPNAISAFPGAAVTRLYPDPMNSMPPTIAGP